VLVLHRIFLFKLVLVAYFDYFRVYSKMDTLNNKAANCKNSKNADCVHEDFLYRF